MAITIDYTDTVWEIAQHVSGDTYAVRFASTWDGDRCTGSTAITSVGPLDSDDPRDNLAENYQTNETADDADWINAEIALGRFGGYGIAS